MQAGYGAAEIAEAGPDVGERLIRGSDVRIVHQRIAASLQGQGVPAPQRPALGTAWPGRRLNYVLDEVLDQVELNGCASADIASTNLWR